jgi:two-component system phosphate regulon sensor histidine kinase PhoR
MILRKNPTPGNIAFLSAFILALIPAGIHAYLTKEYAYSIVVLIGSAAGGYFIVLFFLERFIYRKIKLIYKSIHRFKTQKFSPEEVSPISKDDPIADVSKQVLQWMRSNQREIEELKKQESFRRDFLGNVSHELKTPITNIQGYVHTLMEGALYDENVNEKFLKKVSKNTARMVEMVEELTMISKIEIGKLTMDMTNWDIKTLVEEVFDSLELMAKEADVQLAFKKRSSKSMTVHADRQKIRQVVTNLISNAIKYNKKGGEVLVSFYDMDGYVLIEVTDNGEGIEEKHLPRLFERFYRIDKSRSREQGGTGLGLAIVKHIIEAHQQTINVRSTIGQGTTFSFTLDKP